MNNDTIHPNMDGTVHLNLRGNDGEHESWEITWMDAIKLGRVLSAAGMVAGAWLGAEPETIENVLDRANDLAETKIREALT